MSEKIKNWIRKHVKTNLILIFLFLSSIGFIIGFIFNYILNHPNSTKIVNIINQFSINNYSLPYYIAERYVIWLNMRQFLFWLYFSLSIFSIIASLMTVFYAANNDKKQDNNETSKTQQIVFLSLLSICFTISSFIINPGRRAFSYQHAWRELDICIIQTINNKSLSNEEKNNIITNKIVEMERYIEMKED